jgi:large repetitive protein
VAITVLGDTIDELPLVFGEWGLVAFSNPTNATLDLSFFGLGIFVIIDDDPPPVISPGAVGVTEGDEGSVVVEVPVTLSTPSGNTVTVAWSTLDTGAEGIATAGVDYIAASGTVTFLPGETVKTVPITVLGDTIPEPPLLFGEWGLVLFSNPTNATLDLSFFGAGIFVIIDDD